MTRAYNFNPGPAMLPDRVIAKAQAEFGEYRELRTSIMEASHRGAAFMEIYRQTEARLRRLMNIPDNYWTLFLAAGARGQNAAIPLNLLDDSDTAAYLISGHWSRLSAEEAEKFCRVHIAADTSDSNYTRLPEKCDVPADAKYLHYADNETVHGVEFPAPPAAAIPLVADMSSNILSRPIEVRDYGLIYAGAQKNLGPAGVTIVIVREDLVRPRPATPSVLDYRQQHARASMLNTPPVFQIYMVGLVLEWLEAEGGVEVIAARNRQKADLLYAYLDASDFYRTPVDSPARSRMNVPFFLPDEKQTAEFLRQADAHNLIGLKGHSAVGGCRASIYNAMPVQGVETLVAFMKNFAG